MNLNQARLWARALAKIPAKARAKCKRKYRRKVKMPKETEVDRVIFTPAQERQILWHALYHEEKKKKKKDLLAYRHNWWLLLKMNKHPNLSELAANLERPKVELLDLYKHYITHHKGWDHLEPQA